MTKRKNTGKSTDSPLVLGYCSKEDAARLRRILVAADVPARLRFDRAFSARHAAATGIDPPIRRRSSHRDVKSGYFVEIPKGKLDAARAALADTSFRYVLEHRAEARLCAACARPLPSGSNVCAYCEGVGPDEPSAQRTVRKSSAMGWIALVLLLVAVAVLLRRTLR